MINLDESLINALQNIGADKAISDKFKSGSKKDVYDMLTENGYKGSAQELENTLNNIKKEIGDLLMQKKSDVDLVGVAGGKGADYFKKGLALGLTALSVGGTVQPGAFATEAKPAAGKSFSEKAKGFFGNAKEGISNFVENHPGAALLSALFVTGTFSSVLAWGLTRNYYNKPQTVTQIKQDIAGHKASLLNSCSVVGMNRDSLIKVFDVFESSVSESFENLRFDKDANVDNNFKVNAIDDFKKMFGTAITDANGAFNWLTKVKGSSGDDLEAYITAIDLAVNTFDANVRDSLVKLDDKQRSFLSAALDYVRSTVFLKKLGVGSNKINGINAAKEVIGNLLSGIQNTLISGDNETSFDYDDTTPDEGKSGMYTAVVRMICEKFEEILKNIFGDVDSALNSSDKIRDTMVALKYYEDHAISVNEGGKFKFVDLSTTNSDSTLKCAYCSVKSGTKLGEAASGIVRNLYVSKTDLAGFIDVILNALKGANLAPDTEGKAAKYAVIANFQKFKSVKELQDEKDEKKANDAVGIISGKFVKLDKELKEAIGYDVKEPQMFAKGADANTKRTKVKETATVKCVSGLTLGSLGLDGIITAASFNAVKDKFNASIDVAETSAAIVAAVKVFVTDVIGLFGNAANFEQGYSALQGKISAQLTNGKQGIFAENYGDSIDAVVGGKELVKQAE